MSAVCEAGTLAHRDVCLLPASVSVRDNIAGSQSAVCWFHFEHLWGHRTGALTIRGIGRLS
jgi:hypothetical protein